MPRVASAQVYPARSVRIVVGFAAGGVLDILARLTGQLSAHLARPFIVENHPGASGNIGTEAVARSVPDGYTLLAVTNANVINTSLYEKLSHDFLRDIAPVASLSWIPAVMEVNPSVPARTVPEFIAYVKTNPGKIKMASSGSGSLSHVSGELFKMMTGVKWSTCRTVDRRRP